ncbi:LacI family DNA-binding transcriptional regulator [Thalassorhabdomicrobium marinisediminis]|uniref:LacI family transcriptional regulator n=1 Tax=Thalassorhabdomicrobium marinisediminis TaxID=2170577 RepID=A0A2T7FXA4_9RHOB|nr:LacI family DNA-binding transcriptional regulator [Thalassorhabdomicrobium marinisediminis]PVA06784.1 LacI family transcriptional regulator [Thalassorhabdomicrobium marinisediminis]
MKPKLSDIARNLSVSSATVSLALSGKGRVSRDMVERVEAEARRIGYAPNQMGKALRTGRSTIIGLVLPDVGNPLFPRMARSIVQAAEDQGYGVLIADSHSGAQTQDRAVQRLVDFGSDGILVIPRKGTRIGSSDIPTAVIDAPTSPLNIVSADHHQGGALAVRHLREQGHQKILCLGGSSASLVQRTRVEGMQSAADGAEVTVHWMNESTPDIPALVRQGVTAIATTSDLMAVQVLTELGAAGLRVPQDVSLVGFDDLDVGQMIRPKLSTVGTSETEIGRRAIAGLIAMINGGERPKDDVVPMHLVQRETAIEIKPGGDEQ